MEKTGRTTQVKANMPADVVRVSNATNHNVPAPTAKSKLPKILLSILVIVSIIGVSAGSTYMLTKDRPSPANLTGIKSDKYQALFLTNGQVYFGKVSQADAKTIKISDIYYLQVQQPVQPKDDKDTQAETQLIKLGEELHGPEDEMFIDRGQVLFWENLKDNSKVTEAIHSYKKQ